MIAGDQPPLPRLKVEFLCSAPTLATCPPPAGPEIAITGRSNAGKSSLINRLTGNRQMARVSRTPGRTQSINFFETPDGRRLVDLPGYGYAKADRASQAKWQAGVNDYLAARESLLGLIVVMDIRHPLQPFDAALLSWARSAAMPLHVVLSKADKLKSGARRRALDQVRAALAADPATTVQVFSATDGLGVADLLARLDSLWDGSR